MTLAFTCIMLNLAAVTIWVVWENPWALLLSIAGLIAACMALSRT